MHSSSTNTSNILSGQDLTLKEITRTDAHPLGKDSYNQ